MMDVNVTTICLSGFDLYNQVFAILVDDIRLATAYLTGDEWHLDTDGDLPGATHLDALVQEVTADL